MLKAAWKKVLKKQFNQELQELENKNEFLKLKIL